ncbi:MAG: histidinol dehydrogenase [Verrucomicrobia bacterium]|nr:histidinol dehydrogenase [Verrucomicrobiota bacterium]
MKVIDLRNDPAGCREDQFDRRYTPSPALASSVAGILAEVRRDGDAALQRFSQQFDHVDLAATGLRVTEAEIRSAMGHLDPQVKEAFEAAGTNVREFALRSRRTDWLAENLQGATVGERFDPFQRVGIYIPAGTAPLVSSAIMNVCLATAMEVPEIVVTSPPNREGMIDGNLLSAISLSGATEIYKVGGAQAIAALAFGTQSIRRVLKVFGPGNAYVTEAKRQVFGYVSVDLLPGPSEILVLADHTANVEFVAADLLAQAEHGPGSVICLVTTDTALAAKLPGVIERQLGRLQRQTYLQQVLKENASVVIARDPIQAIQVANAFAPEHLSLVMENASELAARIVTAGAIFLGHFSPVVAGDFMAGPSHTLPTGGAAKSFGGLTVDQFQRRTSLVCYDRAALERSAETLRRFSEVEQLDAHGRSVTIRFET